MLQKRADKDYSAQSLAQTEKFSYLSPDFYTLWNYRREIITHMFESLDSPQRLEMIQAELALLLKGIGRSPKSYALWFHRQWTIELGIKEESKSSEWQSPILEGELGLCSKFLQRDERNFHCWNYRLWVVETYLSKIAAANDNLTVRDDFIRKECEMAEKIIKKNFSNYSAWHYRGKLMPRLYERTVSRYVLPLERIQADLDMLKHAFFTDPND